MTDKQFLAITANQHSQLVYMQLIGSLVLSRVAAVEIAVLDMAEQSGLNREELQRKIAGHSRVLNNLLGEFPVPEWKFPEDDDTTPPKP